MATERTHKSPRKERERLRLQKVSMWRKQQRRENPAAVTLHRNRDYYDWLLDRPDPRRDDEERDDSEATFVAERRKQSEKARLQLVAQRRKAQRQQQ